MVTNLKNFGYSEMLIEKLVDVFIVSVADPDLQIRGGGGGGGYPDPEIKGGCSLLASVWSKNKGGWPPQGPPLDLPLCIALEPYIMQLWCKKQRGQAP